MVLEVDCQNNRYGDREPHAFRIGKRALLVNQVVDRWLATHYGYFKVETSDGATYVLRHDSRTNLWEMILFQAA